MCFGHLGVKGTGVVRRVSIQGRVLPKVPLAESGVTEGAFLQVPLTTGNQERISGVDISTKDQEWNRCIVFVGLCGFVGRRI